MIMAKTGFCVALVTIFQKAAKLTSNPNNSLKNNELVSFHELQSVMNSLTSVSRFVDSEFKMCFKKSEDWFE